MIGMALGGLCVAAAGCSVAPVDHPQPAEIETSLFLIGDAGEPDPRGIDTPLDSLTAHASVDPQRSVIVFLGDNIYPDGLLEAGFAEWADGRRRLAAQVMAVPPGVRAVFLPGNHDWAGGGAFGLYSVRLQEQMIRTLANGRDIRMLPGNGCPGPAALDVGRLRFVALDTQWWLHEFIVRDSASQCETRPRQVMSALREQIRDWSSSAGRIVIVGAHHPLMSGGVKGAYCGWTGPLRRFARLDQDLISNVNRALRDSIEAAFSIAPPLAYVAGHDHSQQVLDGGPNVGYVLVSGAATKVSCAVRLRQSYFTSQYRRGFMRVDIMKGRGVFLRVYDFDSKGAGGLAYARWLEARR